MPTRGSPTRPHPGRGRAAIGWFQTTRYRCRGLRWAAAAGAAICVLLVLSSANENQSKTDPEQSNTNSTTRLPADTRGVIVNAPWNGFKAGDIVDIHATTTGQRIVAKAKVVDAASDEAVIAVQPNQVPAVITADAAGGVTLVLAPNP